MVLDDTHDDARVGNFVLFSKALRDASAELSPERQVNSTPFSCACAVDVPGIPLKVPCTYTVRGYKAERQEEVLGAGWYRDRGLKPSLAATAPDTG